MRLLEICGDPISSIYSCWYRNETQPPPPSQLLFSRSLSLCPNQKQPNDNIVMLHFVYSIKDYSINSLNNRFRLHIMALVCPSIHCSHLSSPHVFAPNPFRNIVRNIWHLRFWQVNLLANEVVPEENLPTRFSTKYIQPTRLQFISTYWNNIHLPLDFWGKWLQTQEAYISFFTNECYICKLNLGTVLNGTTCRMNFYGRKSIR